MNTCPTTSAFVNHPGTFLVAHAEYEELAAQIFAATKLNVHPCVYDAYGMTVVEAASQVHRHCRHPLHWVCVPWYVGATTPQPRAAYGT